LASHSNHRPILYHFQDKARCWSKIASFFIPPAFDTLLEYCHNVWCGKTRMVSYQMVKKSLIICLAVCCLSRHNAGVRQTDGQTDILLRPSLHCVLSAVLANYTCKLSGSNVAYFQARFYSKILGVWAARRRRRCRTGSQ